MPTVRKVSSGKHGGTCRRFRIGIEGLGTRPLGPRATPEQCATLARVGMSATRIVGTRNLWGRLPSWRSQVALLGIVVLTTSLAARTFEVQLNHRPTVSSTAERAKIQHRDKQKTRPSPSAPVARPFYLLVIEDAVEAEENPPLPVHVDDCLYNRPPPRS